MKIKITINDLLLTERETAEVLSLELDYTTQKYSLLDFQDTLEYNLKNYNKLKDELVKKFGDEVNGQIVIKNKEENGEPPKKYLEFLKEHAKLLEKEREIEFTPLSKDIFTGVKMKSSGRYLRKFTEGEIKQEESIKEESK